jgi:hypothetical protein
MVLITLSALLLFFPLFSYSLLPSPALSDPLFFSFSPFLSLISSLSSFLSLLIYLIINCDLTDMMITIKDKTISKYFPRRSTLSQK